MRLWSIHPSHLDAKGLVALWREGLLARAVLNDRTTGYRRHPQLERFRGCDDPRAMIDAYLSSVLDEATGRGYRFNREKIDYAVQVNEKIPLASGQLAYEWSHLLEKLQRRDPARWRDQRTRKPTAHDRFRLVKGPVESWEKRLTE